MVLEALHHIKPHFTILVVDDNLLNRELATELLMGEGYQVAEAESGEEALSILESREVDTILLDVMMPGIGGYETCRRIKAHPYWRLIPVVMLTALADVDSRIKSLEAGADDFISKPFNESELLARVKSSTHVKNLHDQLEDTEKILFTLANVVEIKDQYTDRHLQRMARFAEDLARLNGLDAVGQRDLRYAGILHDIGKVGISDTILRKPTKLTTAEFDVIKTHTILGHKIVRPLRFGNTVGPMVRGHHERWDGSGYPDGLSGEAIPLGARIVAVCDAYDAMTSDRPYRKALNPEIALAELQQQAGSQFDPHLVEIFTLHLKELFEEGLPNHSAPLP